MCVCVCMGWGVGYSPASQDGPPLSVCANQTPTYVLYTTTQLSRQNLVSTVSESSIPPLLLAPMKVASEIFVRKFTR